VRRSRVRFDAIQDGSFAFRAFAEPVDADAPLSRMTAVYDVTGIVTPHGDVAEVHMVRGRITQPALRDFDAMLRSRGFRLMIWERHREDGTIKRVVRRLDGAVRITREIT
jgi:hypothetical protein